MIDAKAVITDIEDWLVNFVEKPHPSLNNWAPCPFSRKARVKQSIKIQPVFEPLTRQFVEEQVQKFLEDRKQVYLFVYPNIREQDETEVVDLLLSLRRDLIEKDVYLLFDHPDRSEKMNGIDFSHGKYGLVLLQRLEDLQHATEELQSSDYYESWTPEYYERVVSRRIKLIEELKKNK